MPCLIQQLFFLQKAEHHWSQQYLSCLKMTRSLRTDDQAWITITSDNKRKYHNIQSSSAYFNELNYSYTLIKMKLSNFAEHNIIERVKVQ
jgi:hypothetical protein